MSGDGIPRPVDRRATAWLAVAVLLAAACAGRSARPVTEAPAGEQILYRISYSGAGPDGSGRLTLYRQSADRFRMVAVDPLGRSSWTLDVDGEQYVIVDPRGGRSCRGSGALRLPGLDLGSLPLTSAARVLLGDAPVPGLPPTSGAVRGPAGRRWSLRHEDGRLDAWTMEEGGRPLLWWTRRGDGGILSHRDGEQYRWRPVLSEPLAGRLGPLAIPPDASETTCDALFVS